MSEVFCLNAKEIAENGRNGVPKEFISSENLIYSSPATLAFNSPGAQGFGVKRAGLAIPDSVMLLVAPGCCGRNTTMLGEMGGYADRFFYLLMDETDIVTGRHLNKIPQAVKEVCEALEKEPSVVMICITCVDALLGTDMERVCKRASEKAGVPVLPCYMYALTREGRVSPMVAVRKSIYSLLKPMKKNNRAVNILGFFAPLFDECELYSLLKNAGITDIFEISRCKNFDEYLNMASANFNIVLNPEARLAASEMEKNLSIPSIELTRMYQIDKIRNQYRLFAQAIGTEFSDEEYYNEALSSIERVKEKYGSLTFCVGEIANADPFELSLALLRYGFKVAEIYGTISAFNFSFIEKIGELSPETKIYSNLTPTMINYDIGSKEVDVSIGKDASYYNPESTNILWSDEKQPFGYCAVKKLAESIYDALSKEEI